MWDLKFREDARSLPLPIAQDAGDCQLGVVVQAGAGDAAEERNRRVVAIAERLGRLRRVGLHEAGITVGKIEGKEVDLARHAADHRHRLPKSAWAWPGEWTSGTNISRDRSRRSRT